MSRREQLEELLKSDPEDLFLHYALAMACLSDGETTQGLEGLDQVIQRDPDYVAAYFQKGLALASEGETAAAKSALTRGIEVARNSATLMQKPKWAPFLKTCPESDPLKTHPLICCRDGIPTDNSLSGSSDSTVFPAATSRRFGSEPPPPNTN